ncbi:RHS repeat domain-containing protein [Streptomyces ureilyticus]|uniref:RHS repeat protein n=1 Tax=Streptomyces ureilyticus TaxID=1775131 RepID=A0ABX0DT38_9ACTN|nr:RHS repeat domain-containing protein [Streptomyces ureilyticus]NGO42316.1 RHS repeat protein [Streptomyces ureilyticus]
MAFRDEDGRVLVFTRDERGRFVRPQDLAADLTEAEDGSRTLRFNSGERWHYTASGRLTRIIRESRRVVLTYGEGDRLLRVSHSLGRHFTLAYDDEGRLASVTADDGRSVTYTHGEGGVLTSVTAPGGGVTRLASTPEGLLAPPPSCRASATAASSRPVRRSTSEPAGTTPAWAATAPGT